MPPTDIDPAARRTEVLAQIRANRAWILQAECRAARADHFSPVDGRGRVHLPRARRTAAMFCAVCPVLDQCRTECDQLASVGLAPQELVQGSRWWPAAHSANTDPVELIDEPHHDDARGAA